MRFQPARRIPRRAIRAAVLFSVLILAPGGTARAEIVLVDEQWHAELQADGLQVTPIDTRRSGDAMQAKSGFRSVLLRDELGWPKVRFRAAKQIAASDFVPGQSRISVWYRTDAGEGQWQLELWLFHATAGRLAKVYECVLNGGRDNGFLIADDQWHEAVGTLQKAEQFDDVPGSERLAAFVWLVPTSTWTRPHRTYVDRIEVAAEPASAVRQATFVAETPARSSPGSQASGATWVWWEAEDALQHTFPGGGYFAPANAQEREKLSNGNWLQHHRGAGLTGLWQVELREGGKFAFWTRKFWKHGPFQWRWNRGRWQTCGTDIALADDVGLRQNVNINWVFLGEVELPRGKNVLEIEVLSGAAAVAFDCWLLSRGPFLPDGSNKPGTKYARAEQGWFAFEPDPDPFSSDAWLDLRSMNHPRAGDAGFLRARGMEFQFEKSKEPVRFWGVNARCEFDDRSAVRYLARRLAKLGVNLVRVHGPVWDQRADDLQTINTRRLDQLHYFVKAMADEGIYTKISFYFPLWVSMKEAYGFPGYQRGDHPFALLFFDARFQEIYKSWARELMTSTNPHTGKSLADDPAVAILEIVNEDNFLFWTFKPGTNPPSSLMRPLEEAFGKWLAAKYGSIDQAVEAWGGNQKPPQGDAFAEGRVALYDAGRLTGQDWAKNARNAKRASDQLQFLTEHLHRFYTDMANYFRQELNVQCPISATNWRTADPPTLGALDKYTNLACDVLDRHAYADSGHAGEGASYSLRAGHTYVDRTGLYTPTSLTKELQYVGHPHIISEYNHPMPNRFRAEATWLASTYGALNGTDAYFHFALDQADWLRAHSKFSIFSPAIMGQFPAAAVLFRKGYVRQGPIVSHSAARLADLYAFQGTPVAEEQNLDQLRKADVPQGGDASTTGTADPLAFYVGQVTMEIAENPGPPKTSDLSPFISRQNQLVRSATGELAWSWDRGAVVLKATHAQGACGFLGGLKLVNLDDVVLRCENEYAAVLIVSLDDQPLATSQRMLLQVVTEDRNYGWQTEDVTADGQTKKKITNLGSPPIVVRNIAGTVSLKRADASDLRVTALDFNGYPTRQIGHAQEFRLLPDCLYYVIGRN